jgi:cyclase
MRDSLSLILQGLAGCTLIDLSKDVAESKPHGPFQTSIEVLEAEAGATFFSDIIIPRFFPEGIGKVRPSSFPDGRFLRHEMVTLSTHAGSHVDAPGHYGKSLESGSFIAEAAADDFIAPGICFDGLALSGDEVHWSDFDRFLMQEGIQSVAGHIVLIRTRPSKSIGLDTVEALLDRGVKVIGTDHDSVDGPFLRMLQRYLESGNSDALWPCHMVGRSRPYYQFENLTNLEKLPASGFLVWGPPVVVGGATASWARVLAVVPKKE